MSELLARHGVMPKKHDDPVSPYLRKRLRKYEKVAHKPDDDGKRANRSRLPEKSATRDPADAASTDEPDHR